MKKNNSQNNFASLYIHVPFCESKCFYCDFYSRTGNENDFRIWLNDLKIQSEKLDVKSKYKLDTIYIGGGTPSILSCEIWVELFKFINNYFDTSGVQEFSIEANPNSLNKNLISLWKNNNVTRVSLGVQSLNDSELKILGRLHNSKRALEAMSLIKDADLNLNADLIFAIPTQNMRSWANSLKQVINAGANHISTYQLTLKPNSKLLREFNLTNEILNNKGYYFYRYAQYYLPRKSFNQYEISNFALKNYECRHNLAYWTQKNIIALGKSAAGFLDNTRYKISTDGDNKIIYEQKLSFHDLAIENAILNLRTSYGIDKANFIKTFGENIFNEIEAKLKNFPDGLILNTPEKISLTPKGMRLGNSIWCELI